MTTDAPAEGEDVGPHELLTDILGTEDHYGDMDFKVAGTAQGVTAIQVQIAFRGNVGGVRGVVVTGRDDIPIFLRHNPQVFSQQGSMPPIAVRGPSESMGQAAPIRGVPP